MRNEEAKNSEDSPPKHSGTVRDSAEKVLETPVTDD